MTGIIDNEVKSQVSANAKIKMHNVKQTKLNSLLFSIPVLGGLIVNHFLDEEYDYLIVAKTSCIMAAFGSKAKQSIFWNHGDKDTMYADNDSLTLFRKINKRRLACAYKKFDKVWVLNDEIRLKIENAFNLNNVMTLANPINCKKIINMSQHAIVNDINFESKENIVLVGRLSPEKGFDRIIRILANIKSDTRWHLYVIGDGQEEKALKYLIEKYCLTNRVTMMGMQKNPYKYMCKMQLLISSSYVESFGLVMLEAMLLRIPIIATDTTGAKYVTKNGAMAALIANNEDAIEKSILEYFDNPKNFQNYTEQAYNWALEHDIDTWREKIIDYLGE